MPTPQQECALGASLFEWLMGPRLAACGLALDQGDMPSQHSHLKSLGSCRSFAGVLVGVFTLKREQDVLFRCCLVDASYESFPLLPEFLVWASVKGFWR